ncbi:saccharopine dehydrogenase [Dyella lipolytica]|uniref:Saccharopine dehydrogenase NADP-binding domain-containing protein n=1 Tax=Dyella lipolytica TaxID=1867835 RepID=A0ABW8IWY3_9GAMM|nr:NAD(P)H-binding protein [Dyella lipolytica]GLQ48412.1 saccharopine dehydrogenase [Dyella lipolytica]
MSKNKEFVAVYGATGHTGAFVIAELLRRRLPVIAVGRDMPRVPAGVTARIAALDDAAALDEAFADCAVVINCAGPFLDTASPIIEAALRVGSAYVDVTAEQASALSTFELYHERARARGVTIIPAAGFYGGLADLLASTLVGQHSVDDMTVAIALDHWWPTKGTRKTGERNHVPRVVVKNGSLVPMTVPTTKTEWTFDSAHGVQEMEEMPFSEIITISRHLHVRNLRAYLNTSSLNEVRAEATPQPVAVDAHGRSAQTFAIEVIAHDSAGIRRAAAQGQDIYAVTAPLVVEAAARMLEPSFARSGALSLGEAFDAADFLRSVGSEHLMFELSAT